jgi:transcriptional regulator with XRE-family HTH domain
VNEPHQVLGKNIVKLRTIKRITQEHLAEKAEISHRYLQSIEAGRKQPSINVVARLRSGLDCTWDELLNGI